MDFTMLRQICRRGRLAGLANSYNENDSFLGKALQLLFPNYTQAKSASLAADSSLDNQSDIAAAKFNSKGTTLPPHVYELILQHVNTVDGPGTFRHRSVLPHPPDANVLPALAVPVSHIEHQGRGYSTFSSHPGNSSITFFNTTLRTIDAGFILSMWSQVLMGRTRTFVVVAPHTPLSAQDRAQDPYASRPGLQGILVYSDPSLALERRRVVLEVTQFHSHIAYRDRPSGTFGIAQGTRVLINSLHRNR